MANGLTGSGQVGADNRVVAGREALQPATGLSLRGELKGRAWTLDQTQALDRFLARVERRAFRYAQIATTDDDEALDLVQDAMLTLVQRYGTRSEEEWGPLFHRILQSRIRDWYRRTQVRNRWRQWFQGPHEGEQEPDPMDSLPDTRAKAQDDELAQKRAMQSLDKALQNLPLRQQQAFLLRTWEELDVAETARAMGCSPGSVKTHYSRAVHALRCRLGDHWL